MSECELVLFFSVIVILSIKSALGHAEVIDQKYLMLLNLAVYHNYCLRLSRFFFFFFFKALQVILK